MYLYVLFFVEIIIIQTCSLDSYVVMILCIKGELYRGGSRDFKGGVHNQRYTCIHHTECPSLEGGSKSGMITQIK